MADSTSSFEHLMDEVLTEARQVLTFDTLTWRLRDILDRLTTLAAKDSGFENQLRAELATAQHDLNLSAFERLDGDES